MKRPYLVVHDYGMGGLWAYVWAESEEQIISRLDVEVASEAPEWLVGHEPGVVTLDVDEPPPDWAQKEAR